MNEVESKKTQSKKGKHEEMIADVCCTISEKNGDIHKS